MKITTNVLELTQLVSAALIFCGRSNEVEQTYGARFERHRNELLAISSDRFRLGVSSISAEYDSTPDDWSTFVPYEDLQRLRAALRSFGTGKARNAMTATLTHTHDTLTVSTPGHELTLATTTVDFPDWRNIITFEPKPGTPQFNPGYLTDFSKRDLYRSQDDRMHIEFGGENKPARITISNHFVGVIMPLNPEPTNTLYARLTKGTT